MGPRSAISWASFRSASGGGGIGANPVRRTQLEQHRHLVPHAETGVEEFRGDQQQGQVAAHDGLFDLRQPVVATGDAAVVPALQPLIGEHPEVLDHTILPRLVLVAVADEDLGHRALLRREYHCRAGEYPGEAAGWSRLLWERLAGAILRFRESAAEPPTTKVQARLYPLCSLERQLDIQSADAGSEK